MPKWPQLRDTILQRGPAARVRSPEIYLITAVAACFFVALKIHQYRAFDAHWELAAFESLLWETLHGHLLGYTTPGSSFLAQHFSPILLILVPFYALFQSPFTLLVIQALAASLALIPLYQLSFQLLESRWCATAMTLAFFFSRVVNYGLMYNFHMEIFYPLFYFPLFLAAERRRWAAFYILLLLTMTVKEDACIANAGLGLYLLFSARRKHGIVTFLGSLVAFLVTMGFVIPAFGAAPHGSYPFVHYWSGYGGSMPEILRNMLNPLRHFEVIFTPAKLAKMFNLFSVFLFLPLLNWRVLLFLVVPSWFILYSSDNPLLYGAANYYGLQITPFLFYGSLIVLRRVQEWRRWRSRGFLLAATTLVLLVNLGNSRIFKQLHPAYWRIAPRFQVAKEMISRIPREAPVAAQVDLVSHVPVRAGRFLVPYGIAEADYLLFDLGGNGYPLTRQENIALEASLRESGTWTVLQAADGFVLMRRAEAPG